MAQSHGGLGATKLTLWQCFTFFPGITYLDSMFISEELRLQSTSVLSIKLLIARIGLSYISRKAKSL